MQDPCEGARRADYSLRLFSEAGPQYIQSELGLRDATKDEDIRPGAQNLSDEVLHCCVLESWVDCAEMSKGEGSPTRGRRLRF